jgi:nucleotide-binding universal stress UspA family protein
VPLDGSALAERALPMAIALGGDLGLPVHLVRAVDFDLVRSAVEAGPAAAEACARQQADLVRGANAYLAEQVQVLRNRDCVATSEVRVGAPTGELLAAIREGDLVVLTTHGRGGLERWLVGSVAEELARHAAGPVLLVRATADSPKRPVEEPGALRGSPS